MADCQNSLLARLSRFFFDQWSRDTLDKRSFRKIWKEISFQNQNHYDCRFKYLLIITFYPYNLYYVC